MIYTHFAWFAMFGIFMKIKVVDSRVKQTKMKDVIIYNGKMVLLK